MPFQHTCKTCNETFETDTRTNGVYCSRKCWRERTDSLSLLTALMKVVPEGDACQEWPGLKDKDGYGLVFVDRIGRRVHRIAYKKGFGPIPEGVKILHSCDNRPCFRLSHLFKGSSADNTADMMLKGRHTSPKGSKHGSAKLTEWKVVQIRKLYKSGVTQAALAKKFKVGRTCITRTVNQHGVRADWSHVPY